MSNQIQNAISLGKETVWGTSVTPTVSIPVNFTGGIQVNSDVQILSSLKTKMAKNLYATKGNVAVGGEFELPLLADNIGHFLLSWFGVDNVTGAGPYVHAFAEDPEKISYTIEQNMQDLVQRFAGCLVNSLKFTIAVGQPVIVTAGIKAKDYAEDTAITPVYSEKLPFESNVASIEIDGTPMSEFQTIEIELLNNIEMKYTVGGDGTPQFKYQTGSEVNVTFEGYLDAGMKTALIDASRSLTPVEIVVTMTSDTEELVLTVPKVQLTVAETPIAEDYNKITGEGKALYDEVTSELVEATLTNDVATY
jgi:hypothetical protein